MVGIKWLMSGTYVVKGYITLCGVIRILVLSVPEPKSLAHVGLECWSRDLVKYGKDGHFSARISRGHVEVFDSDNKVVDKIPFNKFVTVDSRRCVVADNGYLFSVGDKDYISHLAKALDKADRGEEPDVFDNSEFVHVSPNFRGQKLIQLSGGSIEKTVAVFTPDGTPVEFVKDTPLAYKRWGKTFIPPAWAGGICKGIDIFEE